MIDSQKFIDLIEDAGHETRSYSGRGMYGDRCVGVTTDEPFKVIAEVAYLAGADLSEEDYGLSQRILEVLANTRSDSMGRSTVIYWPEVEWPEDETYECYRRDLQGGQTCVQLSPNDDKDWCDGCVQEMAE